MEKEKIIYFVNLYFPELMENGNLKPDVTEEDINHLYLERKATIGFTRFNGNYNARLNNLGVAYSYLLNILRNPLSLLDKAYNSYYELVKAISEYGFVERKNKTVGQSQNEAQESIMILLRNFDELLTRMKKILNDDEQYIEEHKKDLKVIVYEMNEQTEIIKEAALLYHNSLSAFKSGAALGSDVGKSKRKWRKERNIGLQKTLDFIREIRSLSEGSIRKQNYNNGVRIKDYSGIPVNMIFIDNIKKIKKSGVYYSFLTDREKDEIKKGIRH